MFTLSMLAALAAQPSVGFLNDRVSVLRYEAPKLPTGAIHPIWGILISAVLVVAVVFLSLMASKRNQVE